LSKVDMDAQETEDADDPWAKQCNAAAPMLA
jgi:hypothetical protein